MVETILSYLWGAFSATLIQILLLLGPGLVLTVILNFETRFIQNRAIDTIGRGWYLGLFGWLGTTLHELGHAIFCVIFGHKITEMKLFHPNPETGTLGYVKHSYNRTNIYQLIGNFFIGIGPIILGTAVIYLLAYFLLGINFINLGNNVSSVASQISSWNGLGELFQNIWSSSINLFSEVFSWHHVSSWQLYLFIYLVFAIGSSITLSFPDIKAALAGFGMIVLSVFIVNLATVWAGNFITNAVIGISGYYSLFYTIIFLIMLVNVAVALLVLLPLSLLKIGHTKAAA
jgi:hypothetical protein